MENKIRTFSQLLIDGGMSIEQISLELSKRSELPQNDIYELIKDIKKTPNSKPLSKTEINKILDSYKPPLKKSDLMVDERARFNMYSKVENECLNIMVGLLEVYKDKIGEDEKTDRFIAELSNSFIKNTQSARAELLKKYAIDKNVPQNLKVLFFEPVKTLE